MFFLLALFLVISVLAKRLAGKSVSDMTYIVSSRTLNLNSINQFSPNDRYFLDKSDLLRDTENVVNLLKFKSSILLKRK